ncbi:MAG: SDR family oxidoreductase [Bacteroidota bacterium]
MKASAPSILILGSNSDIAKACARRFAAAGFELWLASRECHAAQLDLMAQIRADHGAEVQHFVWDALEYERHADWVAALPRLPDVVLVAVGYLGTQTEAERDFAEAQRIIASNFTGAVSVLTHLVEPLLLRGAGSIIGISSVAGERGRASNYYYGAAKAAWTTYLSGLRQRGQQRGLRVLTVLPGYVRTKMIAHLATPAFLTASPEAVAEAIWRAHRGRRNRLYVKALWRPIMWVIRHLPESFFKRLRL